MIIYILFGVSAFSIFFSMIGYPISLRVLNFIFKPKSILKNYNYLPSVTIMVVAHNEEKVICDKLKNLISIDYPKDLYKILVSSDNSDDNTNKIVMKFIADNSQYDIKLYNVKERKGKTNAQNEAQKLVKSELLVLTDANSIFEKSAVKELASCFVSDDIAYVCGKLVYTNGSVSDTANLESNYWDFELENRRIESNLQTIIAGNGAIYAVRNIDYVNVSLIKSHDSELPQYYAKMNRKALFNPDSIAYEKAGETFKDEFKRKIRMRRTALSSSILKINLLNIFKYKWYSFFYIGHRYSRDTLWLSHLLLLLTNIFLAFTIKYFLFILIAHITFYLIALIQHIFKTKYKLFNLVYYYLITLIAQYIGVLNQLLGKSKAFWEKAESTR